jgi:hypothetical protein
MMRVDKPSEDAENEQPPNRSARVRKQVKEKQSTSHSNQAAKAALLRHRRHPICQAAVLALVGCYLLTPSAHETQYGAIQAGKSIPLSKWQQLGFYGSFKACHQAKEDNIVTMMLLAKEMKTRVDGARVIVEATEATCIAGEDPRLKDK